MSTKNKKSIKKVGRPKFVVTKEMCDKAEAYAAQGLTQEQIAMALGIGLSTLYEKQNEFTEFAEAIKRGKGKGIQTITNRLYEKALEGDNTAMIFYLKTRDRENWGEQYIEPVKEIPPINISVHPDAINKAAE